MTLIWDDPQRIAFQVSNIQTMLSQSPAKFTKRLESFCPICKCAQTYIPRGKIKKYLNKPEVKIIWDCIMNNNLKTFTKEDIIRLTGAKNLTDGALQAKALTILVLSGLLKKDKQIWKDDKGKDCMKDTYLVNETTVIPTCHNMTTDKHEVTEWIRTNIFDRKEREV